MKIIGKQGSEKIIDVYTAHEIIDPTIIARLEKRLGQQSEVRLIIDRKIKGGLKIKDHAQNKLFDGSVQTQLNQLREKIVK